tara:strand:- start:11942 stop:12130 length:189 start_codon:yes stop_codon:yes gene_type:complete
MAKKDIGNLPAATMIEVVKIEIGGDRVFKKKMMLWEAKALEKDKRFTYINYQIDFCSIKEKK